MAGLQRMNTLEQVEAFIAIWERIQHVQLTNGHDLITWNHSKDGRYSARTAYDFQFASRVPQPLLAQA